MTLAQPLSLAELSTTERGRIRESDALEWILNRYPEWRLVERNVRFARGELDLIFRDGTTLVFVEVRSLARPMADEFVLESLSGKKALALKRSMDFYLRLRLEKLGGFDEVRFDLLACEGTSWIHYPGVEL